MNRPRPLFVTGTARSGSTLLARMLTANRNIMVASDPYLPLFRSLRNAIARQAVAEDPTLIFDPASPFQDYYFTNERLQVMDAIQAGTLDLPIALQEWSSLVEDLRTRASHECPDLLPLLDELAVPTYHAIFEQALRIICRARNCWDRKWVGFKEVWIIELFRPLAKAFPEAKFVVLLRDPRATINSNLGATQTDPLGVAHALSCSRHWRKYVAFSVHYQNDPLFAGRLLVVRYGQILREPEKKARELCEFLDVEYDPAMLATNSYFDFSTGKTWKGNSTFEDATSGFSAHCADRWRSTLDPRVVKMIEFTCGYDMKLIGDDPPLYYHDGTGQWPSADILEYISESGQGSWNWRTDLGDPQLDYGFELFRRALITLRKPPGDRGLIRRSFLFEDVYEKLRQVASYSAT